MGVGEALEADMVVTGTTCLCGSPAAIPIVCGCNPSLLGSGNTPEYDAQQQRRSAFLAEKVKAKELTDTKGSSAQAMWIKYLREIKETALSPNLTRHRMSMEELYSHQDRIPTPDVQGGGLGYG